MGTACTRRHRATLVAGIRAQCEWAQNAMHKPTPRMGCRALVCGGIEDRRSASAMHHRRQ